VCRSTECPLSAPAGAGRVTRDHTQRIGQNPGGGTAFAADAIKLAADQLEMTNPRRPRFTYLLSDGVRQEGV
jgi:hypothetical protein